MKGDPKVTIQTVRTALTIIEECGGVRKFLGPSAKITKQPSRLAVMNALDDAAALEKIERALSAINVRQCNGYCNERTGREDTATMNRDEKREESLQRKASEIARRLGLKLEFGGDPRGSAVRIMTPRTGAYNSMGGAECGWYV